ncbi:poxvirus late transcription factor [Faustovirus]|nr:poxvirus late transcription factor [Faustovirus]
MLGYILLFIIVAIIALCRGDGKVKSTDKFVKSKTKYVRTQALPEEAGVESALPPIPAQAKVNDQVISDDGLSSPYKPTKHAKRKVPKVRFSKRVVVRTFEKSTRDIINDNIADMKPGDS